MNIPTCKEIHELAVEKGWWDKPRSDEEIALLICSEVFEAFEAWRNNDMAGLAEELADIEIRIADLRGRQGIYDHAVAHPIGDGFVGKPSPTEEFYRMANAALLQNYDDLLFSAGILAEAHNIDLAAAIIAKHEHNKTRPHRHGGKKA